MPIEFAGKPIQLKYVDNPAVRELYADQSRFANYDGTAVHMEFVIVRASVNSGQTGIEQYFVPSVRLVLSLQGAVTLHKQLSEMITVLENAGTLPKPNAPSSGKKQ